MLCVVLVAPLLALMRAGGEDESGWVSSGTKHLCIYLGMFGGNSLSLGEFAKNRDAQRAAGLGNYPHFNSCHYKIQPSPG